MYSIMEGALLVWGPFIEVTQRIVQDSTHSPLTVPTKKYYNGQYLSWLLVLAIEKHLCW